METSFISGIIITVLAGLIMGSSPTPLKFLKEFRYEHFGFISMLVSLVLIPWGITLILCPDLSSVFSELDWGLILKANIFSMAWGIAQVLALLCFIRIGVSLTYGILCAIGASVGVIVPMIFKASGIFSESPDLWSPGGLVILGGAFVMIIGVSLAAVAGEKRERILQESQDMKHKGNHNSFYTGLAMVVVAGILSAGWGFAFAYSQGPIVETLIHNGSAELPSKIAVWAFVLFGAALINILYPAYLLTRNKSWKVISAHGRDTLLSVIYGLLFFIPSILLGHGMLLLGASGASVGFGITQASIIIGGQIVGFASGEWRGISGMPRKYIYRAIVILVISMAILGVGNMLS